MQWIDVGETRTHRNFVRELVLSERRTGRYKVLDLGGGADSWTQDFADTTVDIDFQQSSDGRQISADLLDPNTYKKFRNKKFNLVILSHILEDIRDPFFLIRQAFTMTDKIFVSVPHKTLEFRRVESLSFAGFHHHRYIFSSDGESLFVTPKTSLTNVWLKSHKTLERVTVRSKAIRAKKDVFDTVIGWNKALKNLPPVPSFPRTTSLSLLIDSPNQVKSLDYIRSGQDLLQTYKMILNDHCY